MAVFPGTRRYAANGLLRNLGEQRNQFRIAPAAPRFLDHDLDGVLMRKRRLVRPRGGQRIVDIRHLQNARQQRNILAALIRRDNRTRPIVHDGCE